MNKKLIAAASAYYNGRDLIMTDEEYDKLLAEAKSEDPNFSIFDHITIGSDRTDVKHLCSYTPQAYKRQFHEMNEFKEFAKSSDLIWTYKLDGCSITAYYTAGYLVDIITRSDEETGKRKFDQLKNKVPNIVDDSVIKIDFEAVCSKEDFGEDIRSNANGLINSCYKQDEVDKYIHLIPFKVTCNSSVCTDYLESFSKAGLKCNILVDMDNIEFTDRYVEVNGLHYPIDGFVGYKNTVDPHEIWKHYANQNLVTTVTDIEWQYQDSWAWTPKVIFNPVNIDGRVCSKATSNGLSNLKQKKCGIGSNIKVFLANSTIPMVGEVLKESENYNILKACPFCGSPLDEIQNKLRCSNRFCKKLVTDIWNSFIWDINKSCNLTITQEESFDSVEAAFSKIEDYIDQIDFNQYLRALGDSVVVERFRRYNEIQDRLEASAEKLKSGVSCSEVIDFLTENQWEIYERHSKIIDKFIQLFIERKFKNEV